MEHVLKHGIFLTLGHTDDGHVLAVVSDGTPQKGHEPVTVLDVETFDTRDQARKWFATWKIDNCLVLQ